MKRFKSYVEEDDLKEFEEDCTLNETKKDKEMKSFKQHIKEAHYEGDAQGVGTTDNNNSVEDSRIGAHNIDNSEVLKHINAFVGSIADREYLVPLQAVAELKEKLSRIGLTFEGSVTLPESGNGTVVVNLKQFGGR